MSNQLMKDLMKSLKLGTESADALIEKEPTGVLESETTSADSIDDVAVSEETTADLDDVESTLDESEAVEELAAATESAAARGHKFSRIEAAALKLALCSISKRHYKDPLSLLPARESNSAMAISDLNLATESLKETASNMLKKAMEAIKAALQRVKDFITRFTNKYLWIGNRFKKIYAAAKDKNDFVDGTVPVNAKVLTVDGKVTGESIEKYAIAIGAAGNFFRPDYCYVAIDGKDVKVTNHGTHSQIFAATNNVINEEWEQAVDYLVDAGSKVVNGKIEGTVKSLNLPGGYNMALAKVGSSDVLVPALIKGEGVDMDSARTQAETLPKKQVIELAKNMVDASESLRVRSTKAARELDINRFMRMVHERHVMSDSIDNSEKEEVRLLASFTTQLSKAAIDYNNYLFGYMVATAEYLEATIKTGDLEGEFAEGKAPEAKEEPKAEEKAA